MTIPTDLHDEDATLAGRAALGDEAAFAALYDRYFVRIYDFVLRIARDRDAAADATQLAFVRAWQSLTAGNVPSTSTKSWLFAIARNAAIDEMRRTSRLESFDGEDSDEPGARPWDVDESRFANPDVVVRDTEIAALVWRAAAALTPADYALLDMHVRQQLNGEEIAEALAMKPGAIHTRLSRLRDSLEEAVGADLLARAGRRDCPALEQVLVSVNINDGLDRTARRRVQRHLESCADCQETRRRLVSPVALFGSFVPLSAPIGLQQQVFERTMSAAKSPGASAAGLPVAALEQARKNRRPAWIAAVMAAGIAVLLVIAWLLLNGGGGESLADPVDPGDVRSTSHVPGQPIAERVVRVEWSRLASADAYSVSWDRDVKGLPDSEADLPGEATGVISEALADGTWYFHLRTRNSAGKWTSTVHAGPFVIQSASLAATDATPVRTPTSTSTPLATQTAAPTDTVAVAVPTVPPTPVPVATATPVPPTATPIPNLPPVVSAISAGLATPVTTYAVTASDPEGKPLSYSWSWSGDCGVWTPGGASATWSHPNGPPPLACPHTSPSHPATITVTVSDGVHSVTKSYDGSLAGTGPP